MPGDEVGRLGPSGQACRSLGHMDACPTCGLSQLSPLGEAGSSGVDVPSGAEYVCIPCSKERGEDYYLRRVGGHLAAM
jgi:hypothetical protein